MSDKKVSRVLRPGNEALDNLHIRIYPSDTRVTFANTSVDEKWGIPNILRDTSTLAGDEGIFQRIKTLNPQTSYRFDEVFVHAPHDTDEYGI